MDDATGPEPGDRAGRPLPRRVLRWAVTAAAALLVLLALVAPDRFDRLTPGALLRIPVEGLVVVALVLVLPARPRRVLVPVAGVLLGLLAVVRVADMAFFAILARPFDLVLDWALADDAVGFLSASIGRPGAYAAVLAVAVGAAALLVLVVLSVRRLVGLAVRHRPAAARMVATLAAAWAACALLGAQIVPGLPVAARDGATLVYERGRQVGVGLQDREAFAAEVAVDAFRDVPAERLLTALRGKDVIVSFVESYGRSAVQDPRYATGVGAVLDDGSRRLAAAGFTARSAFLSSPTVGGHSWLAHATFRSGLWIDNQQRYRSLVAGDRLTLPGVFRRADWRTVAVVPGVTYAWPEGRFYGYDQVYDSRNLGYRGPAFSWATMPDQYALRAFERLEHARPRRAPLMAEIPLVSSHSPWTPLPRMIAWDDVGDGSVFRDMAAAGEAPDVLWRDPDRVRAAYRQSIEYSLTSLISWVQTYGDDNLVLVLLGDHQPPRLVTGDGATPDVPVTVVAGDPAVTERISGWGWHDGLRPGPDAPVWRMDTFRDRFLSAYGPQPPVAVPPSPPAR